MQFSLTSQRPSSVLERALEGLNFSIIRHSSYSFIQHLYEPQSPSSISNNFNLLILSILILNVSHNSSLAFEVSSLTSS